MNKTKIDSTNINFDFNKFREQLVEIMKLRIEVIKGKE